jgi:hypothetical protein
VAGHETGAAWLSKCCLAEELASRNDLEPEVREIEATAPAALRRDRLICGHAPVTPLDAVWQTAGVPDLMDAVPQLLREAAGSFVLPVFGRAEAAAEEKAPGEWVTVADRAAESLKKAFRPDSVPSQKA